MNLENQFRFITDKLQVKDVPIGKSLLLLLFMGVPGKFITRMIRLAVAKAIPVSTVDYLSKVDLWTQIFGTLTGFGAAYGFKNWKALRNALGETGTEALALGTLAGSIDAGFGKPSKGEDIAEGLSDKISDKTKDAILSLVGKAKAVSMKTETGALPEAASSAWKESSEEKYAGPSETENLETPTELGAPEEIDPVEKVERHLAEMSQT